MNIRNIIYRFKSIQISIPYYLKIEGGEGHGKSYLGGTYNFVGTYLNPTELEGREGQSLEKWCEKNEIPFVTAKTFDELIKKLEIFDRTDKPQKF